MFEALVIRFPVQKSTSFVPGSVTQLVVPGHSVSLSPGHSGDMPSHIILTVAFKLTCAIA